MIINKYKFLIVLLSFSINISAQKNTYLTGKINFDKGLYEIAISDLNKYISSEQNNAVAYLIRGKSKLNIQKYSDAINDFAKINPKQFPEVNLYLARAYATLHNEAEAIFYLKTYLKLNNKLAEEKVIAYPEFGYIADSPAWEELWTVKWYSKKEKILQSAEENMDLKDYQSAESFLNKYIVTYKGNSHAFYLKAQLSVLRANDREAIAYLDKAIELKNDEKYIINKAQAEYRLKKYKKSLKYFGDQKPKVINEFPV